jgi:hypothetical protein
VSIRALGPGAVRRTLRYSLPSYGGAQPAVCAGFSQ